MSTQTSLGPPRGGYPWTGPWTQTSQQLTPDSPNVQQTHLRQTSQVINSLHHSSCPGRHSNLKGAPVTVQFIGTVISTTSMLLLTVKSMLVVLMAVTAWTVTFICRFPAVAMQGAVLPLFKVFVMLPVLSRDIE